MDLEMIWWWIEDNIKTVLSMLGIVVVIFITFLVFRMDAGRKGLLPDSYEEQIETLQASSENIKDTFSLLEEVDVGTQEGQSVIEITLYNKKPFIDSSDMERVLREYIESIEILEGIEDREVRALKFNIYDRKTKYDIGAKPDGIYYYGLPSSAMPDKEKDDKESKYYLMSPEEMAYTYTSMYAPAKIDKSRYTLYGKYKHLRRQPGIEPLSDQEFDWFVKLDTYTLLGSDLGSLYLEWELGSSKSNAVARLFGQDVREYRKRMTALGGESTVFDKDYLNVGVIKRRLVIENPSFLWYAETGELEEDAIKARAELVKKFPQDYQSTVEEWVESLASEQIQMMEQGIDPEEERQRQEESNQDAINVQEGNTGDEVEQEGLGETEGLDEEEGLEEDNSGEAGDVGSEVNY